MTDAEARIWIRDPAVCFTATEASARRGVVVSGGRIVELVDAGEPSTPCDVEIDARGAALLPGLVNCHHHFYQTLTRAHPSALDRELFDWLRALYPVWAGLGAEALEVATELALVELMRSGCTTASDHHYVFPTGLEDAVDRQVAVAQRLGVRVMLTRGSMSLGEADGGLPPDSVVQEEARILADCERVVGAFHDASENARVRVALAPCSPFSVTEGLLRDTAGLARSLGVRLHTHLGETHDEDAWCLETHGVRPVDYLARCDWLSDDVWLAHGIHFDAGEIERLGAAGVAVAHCPTSNMLLGSGVCPVHALEAAGVAVGLGVDGSASNDCSDLGAELRQALLLHKLDGGSASTTAKDVLRWATVGGARTLGWSGIGELAVGARADLGLYGLEALRFSGVGDPLSGLLYCGLPPVRDLMVDGQWRIRDGVVEGVDEARLRARHGELARRLRGAS